MPFELLRAGFIFHARGLLNTKVIQSNLDWHWPDWVHEQFNPLSPSFVPRSFSVTHVNLTRRNWTALGLPGMEIYPIVDPRGMLTPWNDGWSVVPFLVLDDGEVLTPPDFAQYQQDYDLSADNPAIRSMGWGEGYSCNWSIDVDEEKDDPPIARIALQATGERLRAFGLSVRPQNPEGVALIRRIAADPTGRFLKVEGQPAVALSHPPDDMILSDYEHGDALWGHPAGQGAQQRRTAVECRAQMASAAALYGAEGDGSLDARVMLQNQRSKKATQPIGRWSDALAGSATVNLPFERWEFLFEAAKRSLILHSPREAYPGPYTYRRFWFRDAAFIVSALLATGLHRRIDAILPSFLERQHASGYFCSQEGEWDSNGQVIWIYERYLRAAGLQASPEWRRAVLKGADWICRKRLDDKLNEPHAGLMPAGFSAEHLGNNDYYYWDDFFSIAGLESAARLARLWGNEVEASHFSNTAHAMKAAVHASLRQSPGFRNRGALPASPYRRMDSGAIGSLAASYPLRVLKADCPVMRATSNFLHDHTLVQGAFFQEMIHSGINAYLTLHLAQVFLREGDPRFVGLIQRVGELASPTGQWPEAIHPQTGGGCMGDGHHVWASAEWAIMMRALFLREEGRDLLLGTGMVPQLLRIGEERSFGPSCTDFGNCSVRIRLDERHDVAWVSWKADWIAPPRRLSVELPGFEHASVDDPSDEGEVQVLRSPILERI